MVSIPYSLKILLSPFIDSKNIPFLYRFGKMKSWAMLSQGLIFISIILLCVINPEKNIIFAFIICFIIAVGGAVQDIALEAYRIECVPKQDQNASASAASIGMHIGIWLSGFASLTLADFFSWQYAILFSAFMVAIGMAIVIKSPEPNAEIALSSKISVRVFAKYCMGFLNKNGASKIIFTIFAYKIIVMIFVKEMWGPFLLDYGYTKFQIATIDKSFGILACIAGGSAGGIVACKYGMRTCLYLIFILEMAVSALLVVYSLRIILPEYAILVACIVLKQFVSGMGGSAFMIFLASLCAPPNTAAQYSILMSVGSVCRIVISILSGMSAESFSWPCFFAINAFVCILCSGWLLLMNEKS